MTKKNYKQLKDLLKSTDLFSHDVRLNFNKHGDKFSTLLGGLTSLAIILMLSILGFSKGEKLIKKENP